MVRRNFFLSGAIVLALTASFWMPATGMAQAPGVRQIQPFVLPPSPLAIDSLRITTYGFSTPYYYYNYSPLPTYMTSINYPWIYGMYTFGETPVTYPTSIMQAPYRARPAITTDTTLTANIPATSVLEPATIEVRVPENAQVWIQDKPMAATGRLRRFDLPPLAVGQMFDYAVRVSWKEDDREVTEVRHVPVRAGETVSVTFGGRPSESTLRTRVP